jgi:hypothetical protein
VTAGTMRWRAFAIRSCPFMQCSVTSRSPRSSARRWAGLLQKPHRALPRIAAAPRLNGQIYHPVDRLLEGPCPQTCGRPYRLRLRRGERCRLSWLEPPFGEDLGGSFQDPLPVASGVDLKGQHPVMPLCSSRRTARRSHPYPPNTHQAEMQAPLDLRRHP